jgi:hypothetical protein
MSNLRVEISVHQTQSDTEDAHMDILLTELLG